MDNRHHQSWADLRTIEQANLTQEIIGWCVLVWCFVVVVCIALAVL